MKTLNTFSFINLPDSKQQDFNVKIIHEIVSKFNHVDLNKNDTTTPKEFLPYNKSILSRIIYE